MRAWSWHLGTMFGIGVYVHWTFLLLLSFVVFTQLTGDSASVVQLLGTIFLVVSVFVCVVLHEFGHALMARRYGVETRDIILLPIGGLARLERMPEDPGQELMVAIAGPAVNVVIAFLLLGLLVAIGASGAFGDLAQIQSPEEFFLLTQNSVLGIVTQYLLTLLSINAILVAFNMLPAFPMDGGRVLRSILAYNMDRVRATKIAASVGQFMAIMFAVIAVMAWHPFLLFIALVVFLAAGGEADEVQRNSLLKGLPVASAMQTQFRTLHPEQTLEDAIDALLSGSQQDFPIVDEDRYVGMLERTRLFQALREEDRSTKLSQEVNFKTQPIEADEDLAKVLQTMRQNSVSTIPVMRDGRLVGLLTMENVNEFMFVKGALDQFGLQHAMVPRR